MNAADHQDSVLRFYLSYRLALEPVIGCVYMARFQRASKGSSQSTSRGCNNVVERRRVGVGDVGWDFIVLRHRTMHAKDDRLRLGGQPSSPDGNSSQTRQS